jgi:hypothetical protein
MRNQTQNAADGAAKGNWVEGTEYMAEQRRAEDLRTRNQEVRAADHRADLNV